MPEESDTCHGKEEMDDVCLCPLEGIIDVIGKKWALQIITVIGNYGTLRFGEIMEKLGKISPKSLTDRLKELKTAALVKREVFAEIPPRVEYSLTSEGLKLRELVIPLMKWARTKNQD